MARRDHRRVGRPRASFLIERGDLVGLVALVVYIAFASPHIVAADNAELVPLGARSAGGALRATSSGWARGHGCRARPCPHRSDRHSVSRSSVSRRAACRLPCLGRPAHRRHRDRRDHRRRADRDRLSRAGRGVRHERPGRGADPVADRGPRPVARTLARRRAGPGRRPRPRRSPELRAARAARHLRRRARGARVAPGHRRAARVAPCHRRARGARVAPCHRRARGARVAPDHRRARGARVAPDHRRARGPRPRDRPSALRLPDDRRRAGVVGHRIDPVGPRSDHPAPRVRHVQPDLWRPRRAVDRQRRRLPRHDRALMAGAVRRRRRGDARHPDLAPCGRLARGLGAPRRELPARRSAARVALQHRASRHRPLHLPALPYPAGAAARHTGGRRGRRHDRAVRAMGCTVSPRHARCRSGIARCSRRRGRRCWHREAPHRRDRARRARLRRALGHRVAATLADPFAGDGARTCRTCCGRCRPARSPW